MWTEGVSIYEGRWWSNMADINLSSIICGAVGIKTRSPRFWDLFILTEYWRLCLGWSFCWVITRGARLHWWGLIWWKKMVELGCMIYQRRIWALSNLNATNIVASTHLFIPFLCLKVMNCCGCGICYLIKSSYAHITSRGVWFAFSWFCCPWWEPVWCIQTFSFSVFTFPWMAVIILLSLG